VAFAAVRLTLLRLCTGLGVPALAFVALRLTFRRFTNAQAWNVWTL